MNRNNFRSVTPYTPGAQPLFEDMIKLNTNENPYPPSPLAKKALENTEEGMMRLYPPVDAGELRQAIADYHHISADRVFVGVGSDDVLSVIFQACFNSGEPLLFPDITYSFYEVWAELYRLNYKKLPLNGDFTINPKDYSIPNGGVVIANPNAPTSIGLGLEDIEYIISSNPERVVVIDEAYVDFGCETALGLLEKYDNLVVVRTFSKSRSAAGLRIGYAMAASDIINELEQIKYSVNSYTMNRPSITVGKALLQDEEYFRETVKRITETRTVLVTGLEKLGFKVLESKANFVFATHDRVAAKRIFEELEKRHVFVRYFNKPRIDNYLRITVGTDKQIEKLLSLLSEIVA